MSKLFNSLPFRLVLGVVLGICIGLFVPESVIGVVATLKYVTGQVIFFCIPLVIIGFIAPSITKLKSGASQMLGIAVLLAYISSVLAAVMSAAAGYLFIPHMAVATDIEGLRELPPLLFKLDIPQVMPVMSALALSMLLGLAVTWTKSVRFEELLDEFQAIILAIVSRVVIPLLPFFISFTFAGLAYDGTITKQLPIFIGAVVIVMAGHFIWLGVLYLAAGAYSGKNPWEVVRNYGAAYITAVGTMSSAATLPVALTCARKSKNLRSDMVAFGVPLFANIHLCGSVLTETFFVMIVSQVLYGKLPSMGSMVLFILLLGIFAIGAPGVPGGTVMASLGLIVSVLGFDDTGTALMLTIFALQDSFGTACNVTGDGALTLMLTGYAEKHGILQQSEVK